MFISSENNIDVVMKRVAGLTFKLDKIVSTVVKNHDMLTKVLAKLGVETAMHKKSTTIPQMAMGTSMPSSAPLKVKTVKYWKGAKTRPAFCTDQQKLV
jgi:hypothetical protein